MFFISCYQGKCSHPLTGSKTGDTLHSSMLPRIVITGAPASGKTEIFKRLKRHPVFSDFVFFDELARQLLSENPEYRNNWSEFHIEIYRRQIAREEQVGKQPFITDRGTADAFAFYPQTMHSVGTILEKEYSRYSAVVQLGSSAILGDEFYQCDVVRHESASSALEIEKALTDVWQQHPGYYFVEAEIDLEKKYRVCLQILLSLL